MRFKKDMYNVVADAENGAVQVDNLNNLLLNIGRPDKILTEDEKTSLLQDVGASNRYISKDDLMELVSAKAL